MGFSSAQPFILFQACTELPLASGRNDIHLFHFLSLSKKLEIKTAKEKMTDLHAVTS